MASDLLRCKSIDQLLSDSENAEVGSKKIAGLGQSDGAGNRRGDWVGNFHGDRHGDRRAAPASFVHP